MQYIYPPYPTLFEYANYQGAWLRAKEGDTSFEDTNETISGDASNVSIAALIRGRAERRRGWWGAEVTGHSLAVSEGLASGNALLIQLNALRGYNGETWSSRYGFGLAFAQIDYTGLTVAADGSGVVFGNVEAAIDVALGQSVVAQAGLSFAASEALSQVSAYAGLGYHANSNFSVGVRALTARAISARDGGKTCGPKGRSSDQQESIHPVGDHPLCAYDAGGWADTHGPGGNV